MAEAEGLAPCLKLDGDVVFAMLRDLVVEEAERSAYGLVAREPECEPPNTPERSIGEILAEGTKLTDFRHDPPRAPEWAVALDAEHRKES